MICEACHISNPHKSKIVTGVVQNPNNFSWHKGLSGGPSWDGWRLLARQVCGGCLMNITQKWSTQIPFPAPHYTVPGGFGMGILSHILHTLCKWYGGETHEPQASRRPEVQSGRCHQMSILPLNVGTVPARSLSWMNPPVLDYNIKLKWNRIPHHIISCEIWKLLYQTEREYLTTNTRLGVSSKPKNRLIKSPNDLLVALTALNL